MSFRGMAISAAVLLATGFRAAPAAASPPITLHGGERADAYVLSRGDHTMMTGGTLEDVRAARSRFPGEFLWVRRAGREYVVRDGRVLTEATSLFEPLESLGPGRSDLERRRARFEAQESALDREEERLDRELDRLPSDDRPSRVGSTARESLERRRRDLDARRRSLEEQERDLDGAESSLERREDEIERKAEAELWRLIDLSIESGAAQPASMSR